MRIHVFRRLEHAKSTSFDVWSMRIHVCQRLEHANPCISTSGACESTYFHVWSMRLHVFRRLEYAKPRLSTSGSSKSMHFDALAHSDTYKVSDFPYSQTPPTPRDAHAPPTTQIRRRRLVLEVGGRGVSP